MNYSKCCKNSANLLTEVRVLTGRKQGICLGLRFCFFFTLDLLICRPHEKEQLRTDVLSIEFLKRRNYFTGNFYLSFINSNPNLIQTQIFALK